MMHKDIRCECAQRVWVVGVMSFFVGVKPGVMGQET